jgi:CheY-like chemotaxis protein
MRILLVEDEFLVASALEAVLESMGHQVLGPIATVGKALAVLKGDVLPDAAILDLNLRGEVSSPVAEELARRHIPFVFATGYEVDPELKERFPSTLWLHKPYTDQQIRLSLTEMCLPA